MLAGGALLEVLCRTGVISSLTAIPPSAMIEGLVKILRSGKFTPDIVTTLRNVGGRDRRRHAGWRAFATVLQSLPAVRRIFDPLFATYYAVPMYAFYPLLLVMFGLGDLPQIAIGFLLAVVAVIINTLNGLDRVPRVLLKTARVHRLGALEDCVAGHACRSPRPTSSPASSWRWRTRSSA